MVVGIGDSFVLQRMAQELSQQRPAMYGPFSPYDASAGTWNGPVCPLCGVRYLGAHACAMHQQTAPARECRHCWCGEPGTFNGKPHVSCCMCQTRRVK